MRVLKIFHVLRLLLALNSRFRLLVIAGANRSISEDAGHLPQLERPRVVNKLLIEYLQRSPAHVSRLTPYTCSGVKTSGNLSLSLQRDS